MKGKKATAALIGCIVITLGYIGGHFYSDIKEWSRDIFHMIMFYIGGQGAADWGKSAKMIEKTPYSQWANEEHTQP